MPLFSGQHLPRIAVPTEVELTLKRGQSAVWAGSLVHRGVKPPSCDTRLTMIGNLARADLVRLRSRGHLQRPTAQFGRGP